MGSDWEDRFEKRPFRTSMGFSAKVIGSVLVIGIGVSIVGGVVHLISLPFQAATGIADRTLNPDNIIYNYEWFKQQYEDIGAVDNKLANAAANYDAFTTDAGPRSAWTYEDKTQDSQLRAQVLGLKNQREQMVADYNAHAKMMNRAIFLVGSPPSVTP